MTEEKVKNRGWVKNAAIIFLSVMLVLTFFSNTIMNRSLPEVSGQTAQSGTITTRIRGSGNVEAVETYEVKSSDSRKVKSVSVRVGQEVEPGDLLFILSEGDGDELKAARDKLEELQYNYQKALINAGETDGNGENRTIARAREKLQNAISKRDKVAGATDEVISDARTDLATKKAAYETAQDKLEAAGGEGSGSSGDYSQVTAAQNKLNAAKTALEATKIQYQNDYDAFQKIAEHQRNGNDLNAYMQYLYTQYAEKAEPSPSPKITKDEDEDEQTVGALGYGVHLFSTPSGDVPGKWSDVTVIKIDDTSDPAKVTITYTKKDDTQEKTVTYLKNDLATAYDEISSATQAHTDAQDAYNRAVNSYYDSYQPSNSGLAKKVREAKAALDAAQERYDDLLKKQTEYETAEDNVVAAQDALEKAIMDQKLETLDLQKMRADIADAQNEVSELAGKSGEGGEILSEVYGVVKAINVTAGNSSDPQTPMCTIEVPDRGYQVSISVTSEQAKKVSVGDSAEVSTGYWGSSGLTGRLTSIRPDPKDPTNKKLLVFEITGEVESGTQVSVSIGQKSQSFEVIIPNSALREDSNGKYVLVVEAKQSALGNRYVATRVDVQVLASDDTYTAVSGGLSTGDFVITNSTKPIEKGMQVRIAES